ncbi:helix-turn-helix transcriptional regulator [Novosphingobium sp. NBM11]|uniref:helix-turn-helix domain-containing protein n=1 Tax=Novosphingobium sp. NBM11 TaxID=2596914 RepID=UPI001891FCDB|nr:AraC family transcriptional regulator [Novosphingobium sp. NBM11]MBF5088761.1 helix-turn-helix transcriptional regulator [Novosphingobium sp. NBM11]
MVISREPENPEFYRHVNGKAHVSTRASPSLRLEKVDRVSDEPVVARYRQPCLSLFMFDAGYRHFSVDVAGEVSNVSRPQRSVFALLPAAEEVRGEFHAVGDRFRYSIAYIEIDFLSASDRALFDRPLVGFEDTTLQWGMSELGGWSHDPTFPLMAEGWALQCVARLRAKLGDRKPGGARSGGLAPARLKMVTDYIEHRIQESITLHELAAIAGLSIRQFARSFQASKGKTPARYIHDRRLGRAREMLAMPGFSMTDVAYACGFSHAQHFSNSFQRSTGMTPTEFRQANGGRCDAV